VHELVGHAGQAAQSFDALGHEVDLVVAADLADRDLRVRVGVEEGMPGVAALSLARISTQPVEATLSQGFATSSR
jgi:hypothetical protein